MNKTLKYLRSSEVISGRDATEYIFYFTLVNTELIGSPEEQSSTQLISIKSSISGTLESIWNYHYADINIEKILFEYGKRHLIDKIKENSVIDKDELWLTTNTAPSICPFDSSRIVYQPDETYDIVVGQNKLMSDQELIKIATSIIETRDYINAIIKEKYTNKLFIVKNERDLLQLFINADTVEDFAYRLNGLQNIVVNMREELLREITKINDSNVKSISLFNEYLKTHKTYNENIVIVFKNINRLRQAYPIHGDNEKGVQEAHQFFDIPYPIVNYNEAWIILLNHYLESLKQCLKIITEET